jgi:hypothetical protein
MSNGEPVSRAAFGSIAMSIMATSFAMQTIAYVERKQEHSLLLVLHRLTFLLHLLAGLITTSIR